MSNEEFKILYHPHYMDPVEENKNIKKNVNEETNPCEELEFNYKSELDKLISEIDGLNAIIKNLEEDNRKLINDKNDLLKKLEEREKLEILIENLSKNMIEAFAEEKGKITNELIGFIIAILKRLLLTDILPKEEALMRALSKVFESGIDLKGQINLYLNPKDFQRINPYLEKLKERTEGLFYINPVVREELNEGEFLIETQKLWIERRYEDLLQDLIEDMRDERDIQGLS